MNTNYETLKAANWDEVERETVQKIRALKAVVDGIDPDQMGPMEDQLCNGLILPALRHLAAFNLSVTVEEEEATETEVHEIDLANPEEARAEVQQACDACLAGAPCDTTPDDSQTPETDAFFRPVPGAGNGRVIGKIPDFCRRLERQRNEARKQRDVLANAIRSFATAFDELHWSRHLKDAEELVNSLCDSLSCLEGGESE